MLLRHQIFYKMNQKRKKEFLIVMKAEISDLKLANKPTSVHFTTFIYLLI